MVELIGELARAPDWPHDRSPYVEPWESVGDDDPFADDEDDPFADDEGEEDDEELPEDRGGTG